MNRRSLWLLIALVVLLVAVLALMQNGPVARAQMEPAGDATTQSAAPAEATAWKDGSTQPAEVKTSTTAEATTTQGSQAEPGAMSGVTNTRSSQVMATGSTDVAVHPLVTRATIERRAATVSTVTTAKTDSKLTAIARRVDASAKSQGKATVAARLAAKFGMTVDALLAEKAVLGASWGQLMIAHSLAAKSAMTVEQLIAMHEDGMGWGKIAAGLGIKVGSAVSAANAGAHAVQGLAKADGHASSLRGEGARAGVRGGLASGVGAGHGRGVGAGTVMGIGH